MKIEEQVVSLELAQKLKALGVKQESVFYYYDEKIIGGNDFGGYEIRTDLIEPDYSAFTVAELGNILPKAISITATDENKMEFCNFRLVTGRNVIMEEESLCEFWTINYICDSTNEFRNWLFDKLLTKNIYDKNEANGRAKMLIYLFENKLVEIK